MSIPERTSTLVIGGGPSGLVSLKYVLEYGPPCDGSEGGEAALLVEAESDIGGTLRWRDYENAELVSSKQLTCFSDFRYPLEAPDHPSLPNYVEYLRSYAEHFKLFEHIRLETRCISLSLTASSASSSAPSNTDGDEYKHHAILRRGDEVYHVLTKRVIITTGLHVTPNIPSIPGLNAEPLPAEPIKHIHSSAYKSRSQLKGKCVLVVGAGETAMDVGYEAVVGGATQVFMAVRSGFLSFPKVLNNFRVLGTTFDGNLPIDGLITNLFETAYVHPWVSRSHLRWFVSDFVIRRVLWALTGTQAGCNQWAGELPPERQGRAYVFLNKSAKAMQFINAPYYRLSRIHRLFAHYIDPPLPAELRDSAGNDSRIANGASTPAIHVVPFPASFDPTGTAVFPAPPKHRKKEQGWKMECRPDLVVLCTGYKQEWEWLGPGYPQGPDKCDVRGVCGSKDLSVGFIGFLRPGVGAIPPMAEAQIQLFLALNQGRIPIPTTPETYHLLHSPTSRIQYGVDYSTYMSTLAKDIGAAPGLRELWREYGWFVVFVYCFGAAFPTFYRLTGPYRSDKAAEIVKTELWETIKRRGVIGNIFMGVIPMAFYAYVNLCAYVLDGVWTLVRPLLGYGHGRASQAQGYGKVKVQ